MDFLKNVFSLLLLMMLTTCCIVSCDGNQSTIMTDCEQLSVAESPPNLVGMWIMGTVYDINGEVISTYNPSPTDPNLQITNHGFEFKTNDQVIVHWTELMAGEIKTYRYEGTIETAGTNSFIFHGDLFAGATQVVLETDICWTFWYEDPYVAGPNTIWKVIITNDGDRSPIASAEMIKA